MFSKEIKIKVVLDYLSGKSYTSITRKYGIKGSATIYHWVRLFKEFGVEGLANNYSKTFYDYSFKIKVITWRVDHRASYPVTAKRYKIRNPTTIWQWERDLESGRLKPNDRRSGKMTDKKPRTAEELKHLEEENRRLKIRVAYLEKLHALTQKKKNSQIKKKHK
ncbi:helix-turn-helix domain-containing protein [Companilactobacillus pabuli]|uniref:helix-turn-helix domain-containing protein n=1 Tax=Companilactobacillus pabuli TaxID=2714036 RepID=UPI0035148CE6